MADRTKVIAEVPQELRDEMDELGFIVDMKMGPIVREAIDRFMPILRQRAAERASLKESAQEPATAAAGS